MISGQSAAISASRNGTTASNACTAGRTLSGCSGMCASTPEQVSASSATSQLRMRSPRSITPYGMQPSVTRAPRDDVVVRQVAVHRLGAQLVAQRGEPRRGLAGQPLDPLAPVGVADVHDESPDDGLRVPQVPLHRQVETLVLERREGARDLAGDRSEASYDGGSQVVRIAQRDTLEVREQPQRELLAAYVEPRDRAPVERRAHAGHVEACCGEMLERRVLGRQCDGRPGGVRDLQEQLLLRGVDAVVAVLLAPELAERALHAVVLGRRALGLAARDVGAADGRLGERAPVGHVSLTPPPYEPRLGASTRNPWQA